MASDKRYFESFEIRRFRGFRELKLPKLRRVTVIGGKNGAGKTSILEAMFLHLDRNDAAILTRPASFRMHGFSFQADVKRMFWNGDTGSEMAFEANTRVGKEVLRFTYGTVPQPSVAQVITSQPPTSDRTTSPPVTTASIQGVTMRFVHKNISRGTAYYSESSPIGVITQVTEQIAPAPIAIFLSPTTRYNPKDLADGFTNVVQRESLDVLLGAPRVVQTTIKHLQLLQVADASVIHGDIGAGIQIPITVLGDGAVAIVAIILAVIRAENGVVLVDEFDTSVHYSVLRQIWAIIGEVAGQFNCQLIVSTHSRECIQAASDGMDDAGRHDDLLYIRLDRIEGDPGKPEQRATGHIAATTYEPDELASALKEEWEVR
jgi:ABC-type cobalamin/Fe3+-siderophores transport system ATPase subunit